MSAARLPFRPYPLTLYTHTHVTLLNGFKGLIKKIQREPSLIVIIKSYSSSTSVLILVLPELLFPIRLIINMVSTWSAPFFTSSLTIPSCPFHTARRSGVFPPEFRALSSALLRKSTWQAPCPCSRCLHTENDRINGYFAVSKMLYTSSLYLYIYHNSFMLSIAMLKISFILCCVS